MNSRVLSIISDQTNSFIDKIKSNIQTSGQFTTGKSSDSIHSLISESGGIFTIEVNAKAFFGALETGRKPTPDKKPSRAMIDNIKEWTNAKGFPESMAWAVATNINKFGTKLWQKGGRTDIFSNEKEPFIKELFKALADELGQEYFKNMKDTF